MATGDQDYASGMRKGATIYNPLRQILENQLAIMKELHFQYRYETTESKTIKENIEATEKLLNGK